MGSARLHVDASDAADFEEKLPDYWDELDEDERKDWIAETVQKFLKGRFAINVEIVE